MISYQKLKKACVEGKIAHVMRSEWGNIQELAGPLEFIDLEHYKVILILHKNPDSGDYIYTNYWFPRGCPEIVKKYKGYRYDYLCDYSYGEGGHPQVCNAVKSIRLYEPSELDALTKKVEASINAFKKEWNAYKYEVSNTKQVSKVKKLAEQLSSLYLFY